DPPRDGWPAGVDPGDRGESAGCEERSRRAHRPEPAPREQHLAERGTERDAEVQKDGEPAQDLAAALERSEVGHEARGRRIEARDPDAHHEAYHEERWDLAVRAESDRHGDHDHAPEAEEDPARTAVVEAPG